jgi:hypothetical protein
MPSTPATTPNLGRITYTAVLPDGTTDTRTSATMAYTHAVIAMAPRATGDLEWVALSWHKSEAAAHKATISRYTNHCMDRQVVAVTGEPATKKGQAAKAARIAEIEAETDRNALYELAGQAGTAWERVTARLRLTELDDRRDALENAEDDSPELAAAIEAQEAEHAAEKVDAFAALAAAEAAMVEAGELDPAEAVGEALQAETAAEIVAGCDGDLHALETLANHHASQSVRDLAGRCLEIGQRAAAEADDGLYRLPERAKAVTRPYVHRQTRPTRTACGITPVPLDVEMSTRADRVTCPTCIDEQAWTDAAQPPVTSLTRATQRELAKPADPFPAAAIEFLKALNVERDLLLNAREDLALRMRCPDGSVATARELLNRLTQLRYEFDAIDRVLHALNAAMSIRGAR